MLLADANDSDVFMDSVNRQIAMKMLVGATCNIICWLCANRRVRLILQDGQRAGNSSS